VIPDRIIEQGTLKTRGQRAAVEVRIPWYRALPASCIASASLTIDGVTAPADSLRWTLNGRDRTFSEMSDDTEEWWFPLDSAVLSGDIPVTDGDADHNVAVDLTIFIPYIVIGEDEVLHIEEHDSKTMKVTN
jgi:hypothetical protein